MTEILTFEEIQHNKTKELTQEEWNKHEKWMDDLIESAKNFRENNPI